MISASGCIFIYSMYDTLLSNERSSITALTKFVKFSVLPILNDLTSFTNSCSIFFQTDFGIYAREAAEHFCP